MKVKPEFVVLRGRNAGSDTVLFLRIFKTTFCGKKKLKVYVLFTFILKKKNKNKIVLTIHVSHIIIIRT